MMSKFKKSKKFYGSKLFKNKKCFLAFIFFNSDPIIINLLRFTIEDDLGLKIAMIHNNLNVTKIYLEVDFDNYLDNKEFLIDFFLNEDFKFYLAGVFYNGNHIQTFFFEDEFLNHIETCDILCELMYFNYVNLVYNIIELNKLIFFFYSIIIKNKLLLKYNVNNTSSRF